MLVYLADDTVVPLAVESLPSLSAHELHRAIREVLQLPDVALDAFALWLVSPLLGKAWQGEAPERGRSFLGLWPLYVRGRWDVSVSWSHPLPSGPRPLRGPLAPLPLPPSFLLVAEEGQSLPSGLVVLESCSIGGAGPEGQEGKGVFAEWSEENPTLSSWPSPVPQMQKLRFGVVNQ